VEPVGFASPAALYQAADFCQDSVSNLFRLEPPVTAKEFLEISTKLFADMKTWIAEAAKDDALSASDLAMLEATMKIVERVTLKEASAKPERAN